MTLPSEGLALLREALGAVKSIASISGLAGLEAGLESDGGYWFAVADRIEAYLTLHEEAPASGLLGTPHPASSNADNTDASTREDEGHRASGGLPALDQADPTPASGTPAAPLRAREPNELFCGHCGQPIGLIAMNYDPELQARSDAQAERGEHRPLKEAFDDLRKRHIRAREPSPEALPHNPDTDSLPTLEPLLGEMTHNNSVNFIVSHPDAAQCAKRGLHLFGDCPYYPRLPLPASWIEP